MPSPAAPAWTTQPCTPRFRRASRPPPPPGSVVSSLATRHRYLGRQIAHWRLAASRLRALDELASPGAWQALEQYLGVAIRRSLSDAVARLEEDGNTLQRDNVAARSEADCAQIQRRLLAFRLQYQRVETTLGFYGD